MHAGREQDLPARDRPLTGKGIGVYILIWLIAFLFAPTFFIENLPILLPSIVAIAIFLCFCLWLRFQVQDNIFGEIGFVYLAFAVAYTVFPAYGFLTLDSLSSGFGRPILETLGPDQAELGRHLCRHVLFITAVVAGYLFFRGRHTPEFDSLKGFGAAEKSIARFLFAS